jgi:Fur family zinc uptake transcriptional regulator
MAAHNHHEHHGPSLIGEAERVLEAAGEQWTAMRADVFRVLSAYDKPASAYDIAEAVGNARGKRVAANSVYRILDLFVRTNLANRIESANAYLANSHPGCRHDCIFLICDDCGRRAYHDDT